MTLRRLLLLGFLPLLGCAPTRLRVQNDLPGVSIENFRWVSNGSGKSFAPEEPESLGPGELSSEIDIYGEHDEGKSGPLQFEIVFAESRVALITEKTFEATMAETTTIVIGPDTPVVNLLSGLEQP